MSKHLKSRVLLLSAYLMVKIGIYIEKAELVFRKKIHLV
jgi:hypothetical protein